MIKTSKCPRTSANNSNGSIHVVVSCVIVIFLVVLLVIIFVLGSFKKVDSEKVVQTSDPEYVLVEPFGDKSQALDDNLAKKNNETNSNPDAESKPDDVEQEELRLIYERQLREEAEKLRGAIEEEERFIPLVGSNDKLVQLHPKDRIWLEREVGAVVITGRVVLREGMLELFACKTNSKEHESIVSIRVMPELIHAALLAVGAENGKPVQMKPEFVAPSGDEVEVRVKWRDKDGQIKESTAQDWIWDSANSKEDDKKPMKTNWVFTGSQQYKDEEGNDHYLANETGELFGVSNFVGSILDIPIQSSADNDKLLFSCFTEKIPPIGTLVTIILKPIKNK
ncbi:MAG: YdjY domain-containing protein [Planctomycetaceae bacterium]|jgi:hypothetical protein|nr:YdjY domain-containing protein [Planctomycetaceae bacterium]